MAFIYEVPVDPDAENNPHSFILDIVGYNKRVLEVGCANGFVTRVLSERGCTVVGIELDAEAAAVAEKWAEKVVVGDLDTGTLWRDLDGEQFDVVTFGDVLEHLRDPLAALRAAVRHLNPSGYVALSVPNIAHGDVRMALLFGAFPYGDTGLLDRTHIRFFTGSSLEELIREAGLALTETRRVVVPLFGTELGVTHDSVDQSTIDVIRDDPEAETYQFVVKAVLDNGTHDLTALADRANRLGDQVQWEAARSARLDKERQHLQDLQREQVRRQESLQDARRQAAASQQQLDAVLNSRTFRLITRLRRPFGSSRPLPPPVEDHARSDPSPRP